MARKPWFSGTLAQQMAIVTQAKNKISTYSGTLGWTPEQVTAFTDVCTQIQTAYNWAEECRTSMQAATQWRDEVFYGEPNGAPTTPAPVFDVLPDMDFVRGCVNKFINYRDQIVANANYTLVIGEDMMLVGPEITPPPPDQVVPELKVRANGDTLTISGRMYGLPAMKIVYTPKGGQPREVATVTTMPATVTITKADPNEPENGTVQALFYKKNLPYGNESAIYPVTLS